MVSLRQEGSTFYKMTLFLALPILAQNLIAVSLSFFDTFMVGMLGEAEMAAVTLANIPVFVVQLFTFGFQSGSSVLISQFWGKKDLESINRVLGIALYIAGAITLAFALVLFTAPRAVMGLLTNNAHLAEIGARYARIVGFSYFFNTLSAIYIGAHRSMENAKLGMIVFTASMVTNTFLNWVLIFGKLGLPALGVYGAALATLLARSLELAITLCYALKNKRFPLQVKCLLRPGRLLLGKFFKYSTPVVINETLWGVGTSLYAVIMGHMENSASILASQTIAKNATDLFAIMGFALASAAAVIIGKEIGMGSDREIVYRRGAILCQLSVIAGAVMGGLMVLATFVLVIPHVYPLFHLSEQSASIATMMLVMRSCALPVIYFCSVIIVGVLRGGGDVRAATIIDIVPLWVLAIPGAALAGLVLHLDIVWVYICTLFLDHPVKIVMGAYRFRSKKWIRDVTLFSE